MLGRQQAKRIMTIMINEWRDGETTKTTAPRRICQRERGALLYSNNRCRRKDLMSWQRFKNVVSTLDYNLLQTDWSKELLASQQSHVLLPVAKLVHRCFSHLKAKLSRICQIYLTLFILYRNANKQHELRYEGKINPFFFTKWDSLGTTISKFCQSKTITEKVLYPIKHCQPGFLEMWVLHHGHLNKADNF